MTEIMDDEELNIYCEYVLMPRLELLVDKALDAGVDAYLSIDSKGLPAVAVNAKDGRYLISYTPLDVDWEALMDLNPDSCEMLFTVALRPETEELEKKTGRMIFPEEQLPEFPVLMDIINSGLWIREIALNNEYREPDVLPKLNGLLPLLDEAGLEHTGILYPEDRAPLILVESGEMAYEFSWIHFSGDTYLLKIAYRDNIDYADAMIFPEGDVMEEADHYEKVLGVFERFMSF